MKNQVKRATLLNGLAAIALALSLQSAHGQYVANGGFEQGPALCTGGNNGPFNLASGWVDNWTGENQGTGSGNLVNTGVVRDINATCSLGQFSSGYGPGGLNRSIGIWQSKSNGTFVNDIHVKGNLTTTLSASGIVARLFYLNLRLSGFPPAAYSPMNNTIQVVLYSSTNSNPELVIGEFNVPNTNAWNCYSAAFEVYQASYDRIEIRFKRMNNLSDYGGSVMVDDVAIIAFVRGGNPGCASVLQKAEKKLPSFFDDNTLSISPNPATTQLDVNLNNSMELNNTVLTITNVQGSVIKTIKNPESYKVSIDVSGLPTGIYFVRVNGNKENEVLKFIKK